MKCNRCQGLTDGRQTLNDFEQYSALSAQNKSKMSSIFGKTFYVILVFNSYSV